MQAGIICSLLPVILARIPALMGPQTCQVILEYSSDRITDIHGNEGNSESSLSRGSRGVGLAVTVLRARALPHDQQSLGMSGQESPNTVPARATGSD